MNTKIYNTYKNIKFNEDRKSFSVEYADEKKEFSLELISEGEIFQRRFKNLPSLLLKENGLFYYSPIPKRLTCTGSFTGMHLSHNCENLSADLIDGCPKVLAHSIGIEDFDFIPIGVETFGTKQDAFVVFKCTRYSPYKKK